MLRVACRNACHKSLEGWDHLVALISAQLDGVGRLRGLKASWSDNGRHHCYLGVGTLPV
jgi:hypothetical protein